MLWDALGDATIQNQFLHIGRTCVHLRHNQRDLSQNSLLDTLRRKRGTVFRVRVSLYPALGRGAFARDEDGGRSGSSLFDGVLYARKNGPAEMLGAGLLGVRTADDFRACSGVSIRVLCFIRPGCGAGAYHIRWPAGHGIWQAVSHCTTSIISCNALTFPACR
jgi:hypothetical protein